MKLADNTDVQKEFDQWRLKPENTVKRRTKRRKLIYLGKDRWGNDVTIPQTRAHGVWIILARARYGKSVEVKNIIAQKADVRTVVIFDYQGEHGNIKYPNFRSEDIVNCIPTLKTIDNFGFYLSDFVNVLQWVSMGFRDTQATLILQLLLYEKIHKNIPTKFLELVTELPHKEDQLEEFNIKYKGEGLVMTSPIHYSTKQSIIAGIKRCIDTGYFIPPVESQEWIKEGRGRQHIDDWGKLIREHKASHIHINLAITTDGDPTLARTAVGKVLEQLAPHLRTIRPCIFIEEADFVIPNVPEEVPITSLFYMFQYVMKLQRTGVEVMVVSQDPSLMSQSIVSAGVHFIVGHHVASQATSSLLNEGEGNYIRDIVQKLIFDKQLGIREFAYIEPGDVGRYKIFRPHDTATLLT